MGNEALFITHILATCSITALANRMGKEALVGWIALQGVLANLFVVKQMTLFGLEVTCSDVFIIGSVLSLNLLQAQYGKTSAKIAISASLLAILAFGIMGQLHLAYTPAPFDQTDPAFHQVLTQSPRILTASVITFFCSQFVDRSLFAKLASLPFGLRSLMSSSVAQIADTLLFSFLGLYGIVHSVPDVILVALIIKFSILAIASPLTALIHRWSPA